MNALDRILMALLVVGLWALLLVNVFRPVPTVADPQMSKSEIENIIEDCRVRGEVYIYDLQGGYGEISSARIRC